MSLAVGSALLFGLLPALRSSALDFSGLLKASASSSREAGRARSALLIGEVALSMMLLAGAGLLVRSFMGLRSLSPGFDPHGVLTMDVSVPDAHYKNSPGAAKLLGGGDGAAARAARCKPRWLW